MSQPFKPEKVFAHYPPQGDQIKRYQEIRESGQAFAWIIQRLCPESREASIALTKLQEVVMFANAAIAINEPRTGAV